MVCNFVMNRCVCTVVGDEIEVLLYWILLRGCFVKWILIWMLFDLVLDSFLEENWYEIVYLIVIWYCLCSFFFIWSLQTLRVEAVTLTCSICEGLEDFIVLLCMIVFKGSYFLWLYARWWLNDQPRMLLLFCLIKDQGDVLGISPAS